jgi:hypothetical protein
MGGALTTSVSENMTEDDLRRICGSSYKPNLFHSLRNPTTNYVSKDFFLHFTSSNSSLASSSSSPHGPSYGLIEKEIYYIYLEFCSTEKGEMDLKSFIKFCRETKTLKKNLFSSEEAELIFQKYKTKYQIKKLINFYIFRLDLLPAIALKRRCDLLEYMERLAMWKGPMTIQKTNRTLSTQVSVDESGGQKAGGSVSLFAASDEQIKAVIKLQTFHRSTQAKMDFAALREVFHLYVSLSLSVSLPVSVSDSQPSSP